MSGLNSVAGGGRGGPGEWREGEGSSKRIDMSELRLVFSRMCWKCGCDVKFIIIIIIIGLRVLFSPTYGLHTLRRFANIRLDLVHHVYFFHS
jgi:hypothetical protein